MESERRIEEERDVQKREIKGEGDGRSDKKKLVHKGVVRDGKREERKTEAKRNGNDG